jgi:hypothetical protein
MKRILLPLATTVVTLVLFVVLIELFATAYSYAIDGRYVSARERFATRTNLFVRELAIQREGCGYVDTLYPHPYVGFVHHANPPCGLSEINNVGLFGPDFPVVRPEDRFVILLTGGSVANQFAQGVRGGPSYLERFLNERYASPNGKPFAVLNGGDGAWKQPQQAILFLLYADAVHAVVTLDGYNERAPILSLEQRFEFPANNFHLVNPAASQHVGDVVVRWMVGRLRARAAANPVLSRSQAAYSVISSAEVWAQRRADGRPKPETSVESIFSLPEGWTREELRAWQLALYRKYIRAMHVLARDHAVAEAHFIQPVPAIDKPLTSDEERVVGEFAYRDVYLQMTDSLVAMNADGVPVISLLDVFAGDRRTLYGDDIHLRRDADGVSPGNERLADRIATELAGLWKLRPRAGAAAAGPASR